MSRIPKPLLYLSGMLTVSVLLFAVFAWTDPVPTALIDFFMPGSQPGDSGIQEDPDKCDNCHGGYDPAVEPAYIWRGSMMSQSARDLLYFASVTIANQDAPESGDLCIRCHSPKGWLEGRSTPTDGSALTGSDREGVQCDFCHHLVKPTPLGVNPYPGDPDYTNDTYPQDQAYLATIDTTIPGWSANGMYVVDSANDKRGPFTDAVGRHQQLYSPFHFDANHCGTCHDVSNPAFTRDPSGQYLPNSFGEPAPDFDPRSMFPVERTFSEWSVSSYNTPAGIYAPQFGGNKAYVSTCQDCHMRDVTGKGADKNNVPVRTDLPLHDMTGGNTFMPNLIEPVYPGEADVNALNDGILRARYMLQNAATLGLSVVPQGSEYLATVRVTNETGHKLPSGYPEGRRIWLNVRAYNTSGALIYESGAYDTLTAVLASDPDIKVYEIKPGISPGLAPIVNQPAGPSFHFVQNDTVYKDNRIPPRGFTNAAFDSIQSPPVDYTYADRQYWDDTDYVLPDSTAWVEATLYYQTVSREYIEFLRDENTTNTLGNDLYTLWIAHGMSRPEVMATANYTIVWPIYLRARPGGGNSVLLQWTAYPGTTEYWVYEAVNDAYFTPGLSPGYEHRVAVVPGGTTSWTSATGVGDSANNASYLVLAIDASEQELARSNRAGEFDFDL
jgi:mono/diheme cytochrome c family protein